MATTTNYGWTTPDDTALVKDGAAAIRTLGSSVDTTTKALNPSTTLGDIEYRSSTANTNTRLGIGTTGQVLTVAGGVPSWATASGTATNLLLNSNFALNQRSYVSAANLASGAYGFDRWKSNFTNTTLTFTASTQGQSLTINSGGGLQQVIEQGLVRAGTYTLSWTGTATARVYNSGGTPPSYAASPVTFTADGLANVIVEFTASGATRTLSNVMFNAGTNTTWSLATPTLQTELAACQRYYYRNTPGLAYGSHDATVMSNTATTAQIVYNLPVTMRVPPTSIDFANLAAFNTSNVYSLSSLAIVSSQVGFNTVYATCTSSGLSTSFASYFLINDNNSAGYFGASAEL